MRALIRNLLAPRAVRDSLKQLTYRRPFKYKFLDRCRNPAGAVGQGDPPISSAQFFRCISHDHRYARVLQHLNVIVVVADGHNLLPLNAAMIGPSLESVALRAAEIEDVDHAKIALRVFGLEHCNPGANVACLQYSLRLLHSGDRSAIHRLDGMFKESIFDGDDKVDELQIRFQPASDASAQIVEVFEDQGAFGFLVKRDHEMPAEFVHDRTQLPTRFQRQQIAMKTFSA